MNRIEIEDLLQTEVVVNRFGQKIVVSVFLIDNLLIDTGPIRRKAELISLYNEWEIREVILTHHHEDHTGLAGWIQKNKNIPIYIHQAGRQICTEQPDIPLYRRLFWGKREPFQPEVIGDLHKTPNYTWDIIHTPGHAPDHIALYNQEKGWMFGGDLYVQPKPRSAYAFESIPQLISSLEKVLTYPFETYICSHVGVIHEGRKAIEEKLNYLKTVRDKVVSLYNKGITRKEIRKRLFPKNHPLNYLSFFENSPQHLINSILK